MTQAERNVLYAIRGFNRYRKTFVVSIVDDYYGVLQQRDAVTNAENNYKRRQEFSKQAKMETRTGRTSPFEVDQAKQRELDAYDSYVSAVQKYELALDRFKLKLALHTDANVELDQKELEALQQTGVSEPNYTSQVAVETALQRRLDLQASGAVAMTSMDAPLCGLASKITAMPTPALLTRVSRMSFISDPTHRASMPATQTCSTRTKPILTVKTV